MNCAAISRFKMADSQSKKHKIAHASNSEMSEYHHGDTVRGAISSTSTSSTLPSVNRSLQEFIDLHHNNASLMNLDHDKDHVLIDPADQPTDPSQEDQFIPHEQSWQHYQQELLTHADARDIWIQQGCNHYNYWQGQWWNIASLNWVEPNRGRSYWTPATWNKVSFDETSSQSRME